MSQIEIREYITAQGRNLYRSWLSGLDRSVRERVQARVRRMSGGGFGKDRHLGGGLHEAKMDFGAGYRLYYGYHEGKLILLLCGGDRSGQDRDIRAATLHWQEYQKGDSR